MEGNSAEFAASGKCSRPRSIQTASAGWICQNTLTYCRTVHQVEDQTPYLIQSHYTDSRPTSLTLTLHRQTSDSDARRVPIFSFSFCSRWHRSARKGPHALLPVSQQSPQGCPHNSDNVCPVEVDRSRPRWVECPPLPFSTPLSFMRSML